MKPLPASRRGAMRKRIAGGAGKAGFGAGYARGYNIGFERGHELGVIAGQNEPFALFEGTSIVIPTYRQHGFLRRCIESIRTYTPELHEIIVVDNGDDPETLAYVRSLNRRDVAIRYRRTGQNLGFAGAVNQGLSMARGQYLLMLNNDTLVTEGWLTNLLTCVRERPAAGLVGAVCNYISGDQLVEVSYRNEQEMHRFAAAFNRPDASRWRQAERITGFCLLLRREVFERLGFMDEGFAVGNCEDDDYCLRARMLGMELIIAGDAFIHHYGSVSMKMLGASFAEVYDKNLAYYVEKWGISPPAAMPSGVLAAHSGRPLAMCDYYPDQVMVQAPSSALYWIDEGMRRSVTGEPKLPAVRLSQVELRGWPEGSPIEAEIVKQKLERFAQSVGDGELVDGALVRLPDGSVRQYDRGCLRRFVSESAQRKWHLLQYTAAALSREQSEAMTEGLPIVPPTGIRGTGGERA